MKQITRKYLNETSLYNGINGKDLIEEKIINTIHFKKWEACCGVTRAKKGILDIIKLASQGEEEGREI